MKNKKKEFEEAVLFSHDSLAIVFTAVLVFAGATLVVNHPDIFVWFRKIAGAVVWACLSYVVFLGGARARLGSDDVEPLVLQELFAIMFALIQVLVWLNHDGSVSEHLAFVAWFMQAHYWVAVVFLFGAIVAGIRFVFLNTRKFLDRIQGVEEMRDPKTESVTVVEKQTS